VARRQGTESPGFRAHPDVARGDSLERRLRTGHRTHINWRITPERLLIRLGLADPDPQRTASDDAAEHSLIGVALAVDDARVLRDVPAARKSAKHQPVGGRCCNETGSCSGLGGLEWLN